VGNGIVNVGSIGSIANASGNSQHSNEFASNEEGALKS